MRLIFFVLFLFLYHHAYCDCAKNAGTERPLELPDYSHCSPVDSSGCRQWKALTDSVPPEELAVANGPGRLFMWELNDTICLLFKRGDNDGLNGIHCYNTRNCNVCAYNGRGKKFEDLEEGNKITDNCSYCHGPGPILPTTKIWSPLRHFTQDMNHLCNSLGGPHWVNAPTSWAKRDLNRRVNAPKSCRDCHEYFLRGASCIVFMSAFGDNGAMKKYAWDLNMSAGVEECKKFSTDIGCVINCKSTR